MIDTHCHLEMSQFDKDRDDVIKRARQNGIEYLIAIGSDYKGCIGSVSLANTYNFIYTSVGIHPHNAKDFDDNAFNQIKSWAMTNQKVIAIGEIGLDYHYNHSPKKIQKDIFIKQFEIAKEIGLPVIIHSREARHDTFEILKSSSINKGILHCFSGDMDMAKKAMNMGFLISIAGTVTFKNAKELKDIVSYIPDEFLLIETDAPYLAPEPVRGKRNEPAFIIHTAKVIADIRRVFLEDIARITTINAKRVFDIGQIERGEISYKIRDSLYLNVTNNCTNKCKFCVRFHTGYVKGYHLHLTKEPTEEELKIDIIDPLKYKEIVFCGYGEPLLRLDIVKNIALWIKQQGGTVRINTNGHGNLIHNRNIPQELAGLVDSISISLNAHNEMVYNFICNPQFKNAYNEVIQFIKESKKYIPNVQVTVVDFNGVDIDKCRQIANELNVQLKIRRLDNVG